MKQKVILKERFKDFNEYDGLEKSGKLLYQIMINVSLVCLVSHQAIFSFFNNT